MKPIYLALIASAIFILGYLSGAVFLVNKIDTAKDTAYDLGFNHGYDEGMCNIARVVTGRENCMVKEIPTGSGKTTKVTISLPD